MTALDARLSSAARFVRQGAVFADIGTDHAHLPIFLLGEGRIKKAVLTDINRGPLAKAEENVRVSGYGSLVDLRLCDGASALDGLGITDYAICGMGGELISRIILDAPQLKCRDVRLILQPMSRHAYLRRTLASAGFSVVGERYSYFDGKYYLCICAEYTAEVCSLSDFDAELGVWDNINLSEGDTRDAYFGYITARTRALERARQGKLLGGEDTSYEDSLIAEGNRRREMLCCKL